MSQKLSKFEAEISRLLNADTPIKSIIKYFKKPPRSIYDAIYRIKKKKNNINNIERASKRHISKLSSRAIRAINRDIIRSPRKTNKRLLQENSLDISTRTLQRALKSEGWSINICSKKSILNAEKAKNRLDYAKRRLKELSSIDFSKIIFSDESGIQRNAGSRSEYIRKRGNHKVGKYLAATRNKSTFKNIINI